jgi:hypothetical protein
MFANGYAGPLYLLLVNDGFVRALSCSVRMGVEDVAGP